MSPLLGQPRTGDWPRPAPVPVAGPPPRRHRRRAPAAFRPVFALLVAVVVVVVVAASTPAIRKELRQSFSPVPSQYTELYFTHSPTIARNTAIIPISVVDHGAAEGKHRLRVWLEASDGRTTASTTTTFARRPDALTETVARLPLQEGSVVVHVTLLGRDESLHFRLGADVSPTRGSTP
ncbi:hypothetical protein [Streptomyces cyaneochromogenes]|uniref:hypothetical protein n=1 Tax=Streptomyces cyaneochromogenes TaxID=2496836 RepID=UPI00158A1F25|nr:hypothetical protein [Streptomyces cyaneochromogenes]